MVETPGAAPHRNPGRGRGQPAVARPRVPRHGQPLPDAPTEGIPADQRVDLDDQLAELIALRGAGKIGGCGLSHVDADDLLHAPPAGIVCVQNSYSLVDRSAEGVLQICRERDIAWVPSFPLGSGFSGLPRVTDQPTVKRWQLGWE